MQRGEAAYVNPEGFSLIEIMIALVILTFGLLATAQLIYLSVGSGSLARSKQTASIAAQQRMEYLSDLYRLNPDAEDLAPGSHGPQEDIVENPVDGKILNRYRVSWSSAGVADPRPGKAPRARLVSATIVPIRPDGSINLKPALNKTLTFSTIVSLKTP
jgi:prepilin-type N-terminal cleavage/methylation domain-containing protein